jgi:hypothetical protein
MRAIRCRSVYRNSVYRSPHNISQPTIPTSPPPRRADVFDCDLSHQPGGHYPATLFRFPLRTAAQAEGSLLRTDACSVAAVAAMLRDFAAEGAETALFLQVLRLGRRRRISTWQCTVHW